MELDPLVQRRRDSPSDSIMYGIYVDYDRRVAKLKLLFILTKQADFVPS